MLPHVVAEFLFPLVANAAQDFNLASWEVILKITSVISFTHPNPFNLNKKDHQI